MSDATDELLEQVLDSLNGPKESYRHLIADRDKVLARICWMAEHRAKRKRVPVWSVIGEITGHGSGVSAAIYEYYRDKSGKAPVE